MGWIFAQSHTKTEGRNWQRMRLTSDLLVHVLHLLMHTLHTAVVMIIPASNLGSSWMGYNSIVGGRQAGIYPSENFAATSCGKSGVDLQE